MDKMKKTGQLSKAYRVIKDFGDARAGDTCFETGHEKNETQFHSNSLFDSGPVYNASGKLVNQQSPSRDGESYWVEWLKNDKVKTYLAEK